MVGFNNVEMVFLGQVPDAAVAAPSTKPEIPQVIRSLSGGPFDLKSYILMWVERDLG